MLYAPFSLNIYARDYDHTVDEKCFAEMLSNGCAIAIYDPKNGAECETVLCARVCWWIGWRRRVAVLCSDDMRDVNVLSIRCVEKYEYDAKLSSVIVQCLSLSGKKVPISRLSDLGCSCAIQCLFSTAFGIAVLR